MRYLFVSLLLICYFAFCYWCWVRYQRQHSVKFQQHLSAVENIWLVAFASQTGNAEEIAEKTAQQLRQANIAVATMSLNKITIAQLQQTRKILFIVSTYGEGEAPDNGANFLRRVKGLDLSGLNYAVLALGDKAYVNFCAFGHEVYHALHACNAEPSFDLVEVDQCDGSALRHWQYHLGQLTGHSYFSDWSKPGYDTWRLAERRCLNPGSAGAPVFLLRMKPLSGSLQANQWVAGDIAEIGPYNDSALPHREYSIASIPSDGTLDLLVRQAKNASGELGLGSGWLTQNAPAGGDIFLRIRTNSSFHGSFTSMPMILIGNGTGIAGLRAHLRARIQQGAHQNWLFFGERNAACDLFFGDEIKTWCETKAIDRCDLVFSREQATSNSPRYVQDLLPNAAADLRLWVEQGAAIFVCGSLQGMAQGVDKALEEILGRQQLEQLAESGRYCRDVY